MAEYYLDTVSDAAKRYNQDSTSFVCKYCLYDRLSLAAILRRNTLQGPRSYFESGGRGAGLTSDSK